MMYKRKEPSNIKYLTTTMINNPNFYSEQEEGIIMYFVTISAIENYAVSSTTSFPRIDHE